MSKEQPAARLTGLAKAREVSVDLGDIFNGHRVIVTGVTVQGVAQLPARLADPPAAQAFTGIRFDDPSEEHVMRAVAQDEIRYRVDPPLPAGAAGDAMILWAWEFSDDLGTDYGEYSDAIGMRSDGTWSRTVGTRIPAQAKSLKLRYPVGDSDDPRTWEWRTVEIPLTWRD
jgi:hypothetical protein